MRRPARIPFEAYRYVYELDVDWKRPWSMAMVYAHILNENIHTWVYEIPNLEAIKMYKTGSLVSITDVQIKEISIDTSLSHIIIGDNTCEATVLYPSHYEETEKILPYTYHKSKLIDSEIGDSIDIHVARVIGDMLLVAKPHYAS